MSNEMILWSPGVTLEAIEKQVILKTISHFRGNLSATANSLGVSVRTVRNKVEKYQMDAKVEEERHAEQQRRKREQLERQKWGVDGRLVGTQNIPPPPGPDAGVRVESPVKVAAQPAMPVPERKEVQKVLPANPAKSNPKKPS